MTLAEARTALANIKKDREFTPDEVHALAWATFAHKNGGITSGEFTDLLGDVLPRDFQEKTIPANVIADVVGHALFHTTPLVVLNHLHSAWNSFQAEPTYTNAIKLSGMLMRYATEHPFPAKNDHETA